MTLLPSAVFAACALAAIPALAQPQDRTPPAPAVADASMAPRVAACTACHGAEGRATNHGYFPRIAGKPEGYLFNQLVNFRDGRRHYAPMAHLLRNLDDGYLREMAAYFARQHLPYPPPQTAGAPAEVLERGRQLVHAGDAALGIPACVQCHGERMTGVAPFIPGLLGLPRDYLNAQLGAFKNGLRKAHAPDCMARTSARLTPADVSAVSTWLSSQALPADTTPASALPGPLPTPCGGLGG
ncbi:c-type cytochrome [Xylophilus sp. ASV27]|uniref:c-type cytochrome n=1 Tax=Xylophilus sp. ASV27 TaxID=2795129 RepID=UPI0018EA5BEC|nr:c-type cytochrome [Xylophilus sp. ASV27]